MLWRVIFLNKKIKYVGIAAAALLAVAPIAGPIIGSDNATTVEAADISASQKADVQKWENQMKSSFRVTKGNPLITQDYIGLFYPVGNTDQTYDLFARNLTPQTDVFEVTNEDPAKGDFFSQFNDNADQSNIFFDSDHYRIFAYATINDGSIQGNLKPSQINDALSENGGKGVTFHFSVRYLASRANQSGLIVSDDSIISSGGSDFDDFLGAGSQQIASKNVVVLPADDSDSSSNTDANGRTPASEYKTVFVTNSNTNVYTIDGKLVSNRQLAENSDWAVDKEETINGEAFYRVATNEWVKKDDGVVLEDPDYNSVVHTRHDSAVYDSKGAKIKGVVLSANTPWKTNGMARTKNNGLMFRVGVNEWVQSNDVM